MQNGPAYATDGDIFIPGINIYKMKPIITWPFHETALSFDDLNLMVSILLCLITESWPVHWAEKRTSNIAGFFSPFLFSGYAWCITSTPANA